MSEDPRAETLKEGVSSLRIPAGARKEFQLLLLEMECYCATCAGLQNGHVPAYGGNGSSRNVLCLKPSLHWVSLFELCVKQMFEIQF